MELKEKIAEIIYKLLSDCEPYTFQESNKIGYNNSDCYICADQILALPLEDIEVEKECIYHDTSDNKILIDWGMKSRFVDCPKCQGTGIIRRPATWQDIDIKKLMKGDFTIPDGGRLVLKKGKNETF